MLPPTRADAFRSLLLGAVHFPLMFVGGCAVASLAPVLSDYDDLVLAHGWAVVVVAALLLVLLLRRRAKRGAAESARRDAVSWRQWLGLGRGMQALPVAGYGFAAWQLAFSAAVFAALLVLDALVFPLHARGRTQMAENSIGLPEPVHRPVAHVRSLVFVVATLSSLTLLGWWSDPRAFHDVPDMGWGT